MMDLKKIISNFLTGCLFLLFIVLCYNSYQAEEQGKGRLPIPTRPAQIAKPAEVTKPLQVNTTDIVKSDSIPQHFYPYSKIKGVFLSNTGYYSYYSEAHQIPIWVAYFATYPFKFTTVERPSQFMEDPRVSSPAHSDYTRSGFDRGHMAPNYVIGRCYGPSAQHETFYTTNIIPQKPKVNRKQWMELEQHIANKLAKRYNKVFVLVGPVITNNVSKIKGKITIPPAMWTIAVVRDGKKLSALAILMPQEPKTSDLTYYTVTIDEIEHATGIDFFKDLPDAVENALESQRNTYLLN